MRRILALLLCLSLLPVPVRGTEAKYAALTFDDGPSGKYTRQLLEGLYDRGIRATFLLRGSRVREYPDIVRRIHEEGHEIGIRGYSGESLRPMSRRAVAAEIADTQALLPQGCKVRFLRPCGGSVTDGIRQVAEVRGLALLSWSAEEGADPSGIQDGDILLLRATSTRTVQAALDTADALMEAGFQLVTVSELAKLRNVRPKPGQLYDSFPAKPDQR